METDYAIIGGGVVGLSVAWGLLQRGKSVCVLDGGDEAYRASRGNFGLVWVQGKGIRQPRYASWSQQSAASWRLFADHLEDATGLDLALEQKGGYELAFTEDCLAKVVDEYETLKGKLVSDYPFEILEPAALKREEPAIGPKVCGAVLHHQDGHVNPLILLRALAQDVRQKGGMVVNGTRVQTVKKQQQFLLKCSNGNEYRAAKVVLAAGLGAMELGPHLGFLAPIRAQRGQVLITEKLPKLLNRPSLIARQVDEGGIQIGATNEEVGLDDRTTIEGIAKLATEAVSAYPVLSKVQLVRCWGALRVLTPDGLPIYQESPTMAGAYMVTCHSGITLAAVHALTLPDWFEGSGNAPDLEVFGEDRFRVS